MKNLLIKHEGFSSTKLGLVIALLAIGILSLVVSVIVGLFIITAAITLFSLEVGIELSPSDNQYRYYKSYFGKMMGKWQSLEKYTAQIILKKNLKGEALSPSLANSFHYKKVVYELILIDKTHRMRLVLKQFKSLESAIDFSAHLQEEIGFPLETYKPVLSSQNNARRQRRNR